MELVIINEFTNVPAKVRCLEKNKTLKELKKELLSKPEVATEYRKIKQEVAWAEYNKGVLHALYGII